MNDQIPSKKPKIRVVQKARYLVLVPFIAWLIFSIWMINEVAFPRFATQSIKSPSSNSNWAGAIYFGAMALWTLGDLLLKKKRNIPLSIEQKSFLPFCWGGFLLVIYSYLPFSNYAFYLALALIDILPITIIIVLLQGKPFGILRLYHRDIEIK